MKLVIFAGGAGTRLWPLSRKNSPKQFSKLLGDKSTIQLTVERLLPDFQPSDIFVATGKQFEETVREQLPMLPHENFIFEPAMRDVGPAIGLVISILERRFGDEPVAILWSDHYVKNEDLFRSILVKAGEAVSSKEADFIFIAQKPRFANQNMGWIEVSEELSQDGGMSVYGFSRLRYRPNIEDAQAFFESGNFVWNLGYFVTTPKYLIRLFQQYAKKMYAQIGHIVESYGTPEFDRALEQQYQTVQKISFDDAILTKLPSDNVLVYSADVGWSDVGAWESLKEALAHSKLENVTKGDVLIEDCTDTIVYNEGKQLVVGIDLHGYVAINTDDVILLCRKSSVPKIKKIVEKMAGTPRETLT